MNTEINNNNFYVIATPIGNLKDLSFRALEILKEVKVIFCEDTIHSKKLLFHYEIKNKELISLHKFNESKIKNLVFEKLKNYSCALISDAGTPTISDPGQLVISFLKSQNINVIPIPGPSAIISALSASGIEFNSFTFGGFLPKTDEKLISEIKSLILSNSDVLIFYESPKRIKKTISLILDKFGDIEITIAREVTKKFEDIKKLNISNWIEKEIKGEIVILIETKFLKSKILDENKILQKIEFLKNLNFKNKDIILIFSLFDLNIKKNYLYNLLKNYNDKD